MATKKQPNISRDGAQQSPWQSVLPTVNVNTNAAMRQETIYDAIIIGGVITGLTAALLLQNAFALSPVCTHAGCIVNWNGREKVGIALAMAPDMMSMVRY